MRMLPNSERHQAGRREEEIWLQPSTADSKLTMCIDRSSIMSALRQAGTRSKLRDSADERRTEPLRIRYLTASNRIALHPAEAHEHSSAPPSALSPDSTRQHVWSALR
jgi:hypothetical protein